MVAANGIWSPYFSICSMSTSLPVKSTRSAHDVREERLAIYVYRLRAHPRAPIFELAIQR